MSIAICSILKKSRVVWAFLYYSLFDMILLFCNDESIVVNNEKQKTKKDATIIIDITVAKTFCKNQFI